MRTHWMKESRNRQRKEHMMYLDGAVNPDKNVDKVGLST